MDSLFLRLNLALIVIALCVNLYCSGFSVPKIESCFDCQRINVSVWTAVDFLFLRLNLALIVNALMCQSGLQWILCF